MKLCPKCGHQIIKASKIGLKPEGMPDFFICSMNMPYQGCGWRSSDEDRKTR